MKLGIILMNSAALGALVAAAPAYSQASASPAAGTTQPNSAPAASAAPTTTQAAQDNADGGQLGDIVVTAERRTNDVQHTALAITALSGDDLTRGGATNTASLVSAVPGLSVTSATPIQN